jgi:hypothetical protein
VLLPCQGYSIGGIGSFTGDFEILLGIEQRPDSLPE